VITIASSKVHRAGLLFGRVQEGDLHSVPCRLDEAVRSINHMICPLALQRANAKSHRWRRESLPFVEERGTGREDLVEMIRYCAPDGGEECWSLLEQK
jgi:hypothetical protein